MNIVRLIVGVLVGLFAITLVTEFIEFSTVLLVSGESADYLVNNQQAYFTVRNQPGILAFKMFYNFVAALIGGYVVTWITKHYANIGMSMLIAIQTLSFVWAGFFSELATTGPTWMWIVLIIITPIGIYAGSRMRTRNSV